MGPRILMVIVVALAAGCTLKGQKKQPDFKRWSKNHPVIFDPAPVEADMTSLAITTASISEVYSVLGTDSWSITVEAMIENRSGDVLWTQPLRAKFESGGRGSCGNDGEPVYAQDTTEPGWQQGAGDQGWGLAPGAKGRIRLQANCSWADKLGEFYFVMGSLRVPMRKS